MENRRRLVGDKVRTTNRLTSALKNYYPQALQWFEDKDTPIFCDFLTQWPTLRHAQRACKNTLYGFFSGHQVRYSYVIEARVQAIKTPTALTSDPGVIEPNALLVQALVSQLRVTLDAIRSLRIAKSKRAANPWPTTHSSTHCPAPGRSSPQG